MMPMHDRDGLRRLERELRDQAESARRVREARRDHARQDVPEVAPAVSVTVLPELVPEMADVAELAEEACATCDLEREQTPA